VRFERSHDLRRTIGAPVFIVITAAGLWIASAHCFVVRIARNWSVKITLRAAGSDHTHDLWQISYVKPLEPPCPYLSTTRGWGVLV
jgi:hypothetical protein